MKTPERVNLFGVQFSMIDLETATTLLTQGGFKRPEYICFPSTFTILEAHKDKDFQNILNNSYITFIDGKLTEYYARLKGYKNAKNVSGYWLMEELLQTKLSHFFYGTDQPTLEKLKTNLEKKFPNANILGYNAPPFVKNTNDFYPNDTIINHFRTINELNPDIIWIGISTPKQDFLMHHYKKHLNKGVMIGVGAVFLYQAGIVKKGPEFLKKLALRSVYRLIQEPSKMSKKLIPGILYFFYLVFKHDILRIKKNY